MPNSEETRALSALARTQGLDALRFNRALARVGSLSDLLRVEVAGLRELGLPPSIAARFAASDPRLLDSDLALIERLGLTLVAAHHPHYPPQLLEISGAPVVLYVRGDPAALNTPQLAIVGSRHPTANGRAHARDFAFYLAETGLTITSGLAVGIDAAAHEGALLAGGLSIAVCATGPEITYPSSHAALAERVAAQGAVVTEFPPGTPPLPSHFPQRNRIISGLSRGVLVVEAARKSGSLATARCAGDQGREVFAIPGSIDSPLSHGTHQLIRQGAKLVETADDILSEIQEFQLKQSVTYSQRRLNPPQTQGQWLDNPAEILLDALGFEPTSVEALIATTGLSNTAVASLLLDLELEGRIAADANGKYFRVDHRSQHGHD